MARGVRGETRPSRLRGERGKQGRVVGESPTLSLQTLTGG